MRPSAIRWSRTKNNVPVEKGAGTAFAEEGSAQVGCNTQIASGQSRQSLFFCFSGQQGMSPDMPDPSVVVAKDPCFAAAGVTSGCETSPAITRTASKRQMNRQRTIAPISHGTGGFGRTTASQIRQRSFRQVKMRQNHRVNAAPAEQSKKAQVGERYPNRRTPPPLAFREIAGLQALDSKAGECIRSVGLPARWQPASRFSDERQ